MFLEKDEVSIYYEVRGEGTPLLLIHGVVVDAGLYEKAAELLSRYYKVITFDRRGNSRSQYHEKKERVFSMDEQAEDVKDLLDALSIDEALIFGASAGAAVAQYFLVKYPQRVRHLILYEPAFVTLLMDNDPELSGWITELETVVEKKRFSRALLMFSSSIGAPDPHANQKSPEESLREYNNIEFALTCELPGTFYYKPEIEKLRALRDKITLAAGTLNPETPYHRVAQEVARLLDIDILYFPGGHNFPFERPREFAVCLLGTLMML